MTDTNPLSEVAAFQKREREKSAAARACAALNEQTNPAQRLAHLLTKQASTPLSRQEIAELHTRQGLRTCANCDHSFNADPKCGLCCGPSYEPTRWQCVDISQLKSAPPAPAKVPHTVRWNGLFNEAEYKELASREQAEAWAERAGVARICTILPTHLANKSA